MKIHVYGFLTSLSFWGFVITWIWMSNIVSSHYTQIAASQFRMFQ